MRSWDNVRCCGDDGICWVLSDPKILLLLLMILEAGVLSNRGTRTAPLGTVRSCVVSDPSGVSDHGIASDPRLCLGHRVGSGSRVASYLCVLSDS